MPYKFPCSRCGKMIRVKYNGSERNKSGMCIDCYRKSINEKKIRHWLETGETGCKVATTLKNCIRDYLYEEQDYKCAICGLPDEWNGKELRFVLDHINGDASNNWRENLRLICPNCDSQLDTFKSKNKNSARSHRRKSA